jgi:hypothetical protein
MSLPLRECETVFAARSAILGLFCVQEQHGRMHCSGTSLADHPPMNDRPLVSSAPTASTRHDDEELDRGDEGVRDDEVEGDKYDVSTLACTD